VEDEMMVIEADADCFEELFEGAEVPVMLTFPEFAALLGFVSDGGRALLMMGNDIDTPLKLAESFKAKAEAAFQLWYDTNNPAPADAE
jgi:hypothetical protein